MDEAFLLLARKRIVSSIKIGDDGAPIPGKQWLEKCSFAVCSQPENHSDAVGKDPNVLVCTENTYSCLIKMHHRAIQNSAHQQIRGMLIVFRESLNKTSCRF